MITNNPDVDVDVAGIIITGGIGSNDEADYTAEVYDVFTGVSCEVPQLPDKRQGHTQVIFDKSIARIYVFKYYLIRMETCSVVDMILLTPVYS